MGGGKRFTRKKGINQGQLGKAIWNTFSKKCEDELVTDKEHLLNVVCDNYNEMNNKSIVEMSNLDEYLCTSLRAQENFEDEKVIKVISTSNTSDINHSHLILRRDDVNKNSVDIINLPIPRRPILFVGPNCDLNKMYSVRNVDNIEKESFLNWRKSIAEKEESTGLFVTPFEKNLEYWRQLWRTIERSHVIVEIVDGRDPLFFRNIDLEKYINEIDPLKRIVLLFNKADLLSFELRKEWYDYFKNNVPNIDVYFFSALNEINKREEDLHLEYYDEIEPPGCCDILSTKQLLFILRDSAKVVYEKSCERYIQYKTENNDFIDDKQTSEEDTALDEESDEELKKELDEHQERLHYDVYDKIEHNIGELNNDNQTESVICMNKNRNRILIDPLNPGEITIGMVGFPNVGKSSVVNALFGTQKSSVSRTPGKTKHIQTLKLVIPHKNNDDEYIILCDCPGLVMPSFTSTKEHLLINGVIPIDHYKGNFLSTIQVIGERIQEQLYKIYFENVNYKYPKLFDSKTFLSRLCETRHLYQQGKGAIPDWSKAGRMILRDYWSGKLLYCHYPPHKNYKNHIDNNNFSTKEQELSMSDLESDIDILTFKTDDNITFNSNNNTGKERRKTKRQIRMDQKRILRGKNILIS
ncbi:Kre35p-like [Cryptosporidium xiaoi]|uniref:Kre35p-like n=1 Tax=Cryptosporidium xiaoi TaxID=659607 RepID=A0AAV9Y209_9CRYT